MASGCSYGFGAIQGGANTIGYWNEPIFPTLDPHFSGYRLALPVAFPTHGGQDDTAGIAAAITGVHVNVDRGGWTLNAGYIQPAQTLRFVFAPPPNAVVPLGVTPSLAETLTSGPPSLGDWSPVDAAIPMQGIEMVKAFGAATTLAVDDASIASLPGTQTRVTSASLQIDRGGGNQFGFQVMHANLAGDSILGGVLFGANPQLSTGPQGNLPTSTLASQRQTIVGVREALHHGRDYGVVEIGRSWYGATPVSTPSADSGGYYHLGIAHDFGIGTAQIDAYRFEPRYAQMVLPYGTPENIWSVAWSWPGVWLKSTYQVVDNTQAGINRQGLRLKWSGRPGKVEYGLSASQFRQVAPETVANALVEGFVDGFYLPELHEATLGDQAQAAAYVTWHLPFCDLTADGVDDVFHRAGTVARDAVSYDVPQYVLSASKTMQSTVLAVGMGRYGMLGSWASGSQNVNLAQRQLFAGVETKSALEARIARILSPNPHRGTLRDAAHPREHERQLAAPRGPRRVLAKRRPPAAVASFGNTRLCGLSNACVGNFARVFDGRVVPATLHVVAGRFERPPNVLAALRPFRPDRNENAAFAQPLLVFLGMVLGDPGPDEPAHDAARSSAGTKPGKRRHQRPRNERRREPARARDNRHASRRGHAGYDCPKDPADRRACCDALATFAVGHRGERALARLVVHHHADVFAIVAHLVKPIHGRTR